MVLTASRNGTGPRVPFPREPLLLTAVAWPFEGPGYDGVLFKYNVAACRDLLDQDSAQVTALSAPLNTQEEAIATAFNEQKAAIEADELLPPDEQAARVAALWTDAQARIDALLLEWAHTIIRRVIYRVEWGYTDAPPDPTEPTSFDCWDPRAVLWLARDGLVEAGASFLGPLSRWMMPPRS